MKEISKKKQTTKQLNLGKISAMGKANDMKPKGRRYYKQVYAIITMNGGISLEEWGGRKEEGAWGTRVKTTYQPKYYILGRESREGH